MNAPLLGAVLFCTLFWCHLAHLREAYEEFHSNFIIGVNTSCQNTPEKGVVIISGCARCILGKKQHDDHWPFISLYSIPVLRFWKVQRILNGNYRVSNESKKLNYDCGQSGRQLLLSNKSKWWQPPQSRICKQLLIQGSFHPLTYQNYSSSSEDQTEFNSRFRYQKTFTFYTSRL